MYLLGWGGYEVAKGCIWCVILTIFFSSTLFLPSLDISFRLVNLFLVYLDAYKYPCLISSLPVGVSRGSVYEVARG